MFPCPNDGLTTNVNKSENIFEYLVEGRPVAWKYLSLLAPPQKSGIGQSGDVSMVDSAPCSCPACIALHADQPKLLRLNINKFLSMEVMADNCQLPSESKNLCTACSFKAPIKMISQQFCINDLGPEMPTE